MSPDVSHDAKVTVREYLVRHYFAGDHAPYRGMLFDLDTDVEIGCELDHFFGNLSDRTPIRVTIEVMGAPRLDKPRWVLLEPHVYGPETQQNKEGC